MSTKISQFIVFFSFFVTFFVGASPMKQVAQVNPVPMLMPYLVKKSEQLQLSQEQINIFAAWRAENMAPALVAAKAIEQGNQEIKKAVLLGITDKQLAEMLVAVNKVSAELAQRTLRCHDLVRATLSNSQWQQLVSMYFVKHKLD